MMINNSKITNILQDLEEQSANIKVIGVGGGGVNAVEYMIAQGIKGVEFICANTDAQTLKSSRADKKIQLGQNITRGLGAGTNPSIGREAALEAKEAIKALIVGADMLFITTGMGGGTGTGAAPVIAEIARELGILTIAVVTKPFSFEGKKRLQVANEGISFLTDHVDSLITVPNDKLLLIFGKDIPLTDAFKNADNVLCDSVRGISDIIKFPGIINLDFADVRTIMKEKGPAMMGTGVAIGSGRAREATEKALNNPLLEDAQFKDAGGILINISTCENGLTLGEFGEVGDIIAEYSKENANIKLGMTVNNNLTNELVVTVIATGLANNKKPLQDSKISEVQLVKQIPIAHPLKKDEFYQEQKQEEKGYIQMNQMLPDDDYLDIPTFLRMKKKH